MEYDESCVLASGCAYNGGRGYGVGEIWITFAPRACGGPSNMGNATVLVVDDDPATVSFLEAALSVEGYEVLAALDEAALRVAHEQQPNVILLDLMMPGMDGVEVSQRLRADPVTAHIPII